MKLAAATLCLLGLAGGALAFPNGAPVEACIYDTRPNHAGTRAEPADLFKHEFIADAGNYTSHGFHRGHNSIHVHLRGSPFKGFFIQAIDDNYKPIGSFVKNEYSKTHDECSAITHNSPAPKKDITVTWVAPPHGRGGNVYFRATVLEEYNKYWSGVFAKVLKHGHF